MAVSLTLHIDFMHVPSEMCVISRTSCLTTHGSDSFISPWGNAQRISSQTALYWGIIWNGCLIVLSYFEPILSPQISFSVLFVFYKEIGICDKMSLFSFSLSFCLPCFFPLPHPHNFPFRLLFSHFTRKFSLPKHFSFLRSWFICRGALTPLSYSPGIIQRLVLLQTPGSRAICLPVTRCE